MIGMLKSIIIRWKNAWHITSRRRRVDNLKITVVLYLIAFVARLFCFKINCLSFKYKVVQEEFFSFLLHIVFDKRTIIYEVTG